MYSSQTGLDENDPDDPPSEDISDKREAEKSIDIAVSQPAAVPDPSTNSTQKSAPVHKKCQNKRPPPDSKCSALEKSSTMHTMCSHQI